MIVCGFSFPDALFYLVEHQMWARRGDDGLVTVGVTEMGVHQAGEIYMCRPKAVGSEIEQGRSIGVVELAKSIVSVKSPVGGVVVAVNPLLAAEPQRVHADPYESGWLAQVRPADFSADLPGLVHGVAVAAAMEHFARLNRLP